MQTFSYKAIGTFKSSRVYKNETPRQAYAEGASLELSCIEMLPHQNFEAALSDLKGASHIWVLFAFDQSLTHWRPKVSPPRGGENKIGVFATRAPYRPNAIGMSALKLHHIDKLKVFVEGGDLLDGTAILDLKPYLAYADSFPEAVPPTWMSSIDEPFVIQWSERAREKASFLKPQGCDLFEVAEVRLSHEPTNSKKVRLVAPASAPFCFAHRTWRLDFDCCLAEKKVTITDIRSGYSEADLLKKEDPFADKGVHKDFLKLFGH